MASPRPITPLPTGASTDRVLLDVHVPGTPAPQGSKQAFQRGSKIVLVEMSKRVKPWRDLVHAHTQASVTHEPEPEPGAVRVCIDFYMPLPKRPKRSLPLGRPDVDKLARAALDGLTGVVFVDDSQVVDLHVTKRYAQTPEESGARIRVWAIGDGLGPAA